MLKDREKELQQVQAFWFLHGNTGIKSCISTIHILFGYLCHWVGLCMYDLYRSLGSTYLAGYVFRARPSRSRNVPSQRCHESVIADQKREEDYEIYILSMLLVDGVL